MSDLVLFDTQKLNFFKQVGFSKILLTSYIQGTFFSVRRLSDLVLELPSM